MTVLEQQTESLERATTSRSLANYATIISGFANRGIPPEQIEPRVNVFTYRAWQALGRQVRKGEHGVKVCTFIVTKDKRDDAGKLKLGAKLARTTSVFHVSQTDPIPAA